MKNGRPGPVWIDVPLDVQAAPVNPAELAGFVPPTEASVAPLEDSIEKINALVIIDNKIMIKVILSSKGLLNFKRISPTPMQPKTAIAKYNF